MNAASDLNHLKNNEKKHENLVQALKTIQQTEGCISPRTAEFIAKQIGVPVAGTVPRILGSNLFPSSPNTALIVNFPRWVSCCPLTGLT